MPGMLMKLGWSAGKRAQAHEGADGGQVGGLDQRLQFGGGPRGDDAATGVDHGPLRFPDHLRRAADLAGVAFGVNLVARQVDRGDGRVARLALEDVLGNVDEHRARDGRCAAM